MLWCLIFCGARALPPRGSSSSCWRAAHCKKAVDERVHFRRLRTNPEAVWSLLLAAGYLRVVRRVEELGPRGLELELTNHEVRVSFDDMVRDWFQDGSESYSEFVRALLAGDARSMTRFLNDVALRTFSSFDSGTHPSGQSEPERFWHGFVLGLLVELRACLQVLSNRESGYGRYDTLVVPRDTSQPAAVLEFKVVDAYDGEATLEDAVASAHAQMEKRGYDAELEDRGFAPGQIRHFGVAFQGKRALVG